MTRAAVVVLAATLVQQAAPPLARDLRRALDRQLHSIVEELDGTIGYAALDLSTGEEIVRLEREAFPAASTIKLAVLYEAFRQHDEGRLRLDAAEPLDRARVVGGDGILRALGTPVLSLRDHAVLMMALSDNTATNVLIQAVTIPAVNARMQALGVDQVRLRRVMMDAAAAARGDENTASPRDLARLLRILHSGEGLRAESHQALLRVLEAGASGWIRRGVASGVQVLSKSGTLEGVRADTALVLVPGRPYALVVMTTFLRDEADGERAITAVSRAVHAYVSRLAFGSKQGRQLKRR